MSKYEIQTNGMYVFTSENGEPQKSHDGRTKIFKKWFPEFNKLTKKHKKLISVIYTDEL